jgi:hypothetical protein
MCHASGQFAGSRHSVAAAHLSQLPKGDGNVRTKKAPEKIRGYKSWEEIDDRGARSAEVFNVCGS